RRIRGKGFRSSPGWGRLDKTRSGWAGTRSEHSSRLSRMQAQHSRGYGAGVVRMLGDGWSSRSQGCDLPERRRSVTCHALPLVDAVEVVLEVQAAEEEGHDAAEGEANGFGNIEVFFQF